MTQTPHTLPSLPKHFESGPRSTTLTPWHAYPEGLLHTSHEPRWPQADAPRPFDREQCRGALKRVLSIKHSLCCFMFNAVPEVFGQAFGLISEQEARLWIRILLIDAPFTALDDPLAWQRSFDAIDVEAPLPFSEVEASFGARLYEHVSQTTTQIFRVVQYAPLARLLRELYGALAVARLCFEQLSLADCGPFFAHMGPVVGLEEELRELLREHVTREARDAFSPYTLPFLLPHILIRCPEETLLKDILPTLAASRSFWQEETQLRGLPLVCASRKDVMRAYGELPLAMTPSHLLSFFARYGHEGLDDLMELVGSRQSFSHRAALLEALLPVHDKALTPYMLDHVQRTQTHLVAMQWLTGEGIQATLGLCELAGSRGKRGRQAIEVLRAIAQQGHEREIHESIKHLKSATARELIYKEVLDHEEVTSPVAVPEELPPWYAALDAQEVTLNEEERAFFALDQAPEVWLEGGERVLSEALTAKLLAAIKRAHTSADAAHEASALRCREGIDVRALGAWSWYLLERWWMQGQPEERAWCVWALGHCGSSAEATLIAPRIQQHKSWFTRRESERHGANAIAALRMIGTGASWMMLDLLDKQLKNNKLRRAAATQISAICAEHGWDEAAWQDRIVPDGGLDAHGTRWFDYGPRRFKLVFRGAFDVEFINEEGEHFTRMPAARKSDGVDAVSQARADYKVVKKQLDQLIAEQTRRFEFALIMGQRWEVSDWREFILEHPLLQHFARKLLWAEVDAQNEVMKLFIPDEDGALIDASYEPVSLPDEGFVRLVHPAELSQEALSQWVELMADFEVVQPISQLTRPIFRAGSGDWERAREHLGTVKSFYAPDVREKLSAHYPKTFWQEQCLVSPNTIGALFYTVERWEVRYIFNPQVWVDGYGEADAARGAGVFLLRRGEAPVLNPEQVPARITAEALHQVEIISQVLSR